jgi:2-keto-4-pentenoate hydratase/2-oxohepta-3-ene-1,7-dioic acid hydratase in catechol pathway
MFSPRDRDLPRGWPGRLEDDRVVPLAALTLQAFFTGGGTAREHAVYALDEVVLRAPVLHPPSIRVFSADGDFTFANPASVVGPDEPVRLPAGASAVEPELRLAAVIGAEGAIGGFTLVNDWIASELPGAKARDFATSVGPVVVTPDELAVGPEWLEYLERAGRNTRLLPGDILAGPGVRDGVVVRAGAVGEVAVDGIGVLRNPVVT